jgi:hypothetical protein
VSSRTITGEKLSSGGGSGVTLGTAGIRIDRGNLVDAQLLYDEALNPYNPDSATDGEGAFKLTYANGDPIGLRTNSISSGGDISLQPGGVVRVFKVNYESAVIAFGDNAIPNKKYVDDTITSSIFGLSYPKIERGDTEIRVRDSLASVATIAATGNGTTATLTFATQPFVLFEVGQLITVTGIDPVGYNGTHVVQAATASTVSYLNATTAGQTVAGTINDAVSKATIEIDGVLKNTFFANQVDFLQEQINLADIRIQESTISAPGTNSGDLVLQAQGTNSVRIDDTLMIKATGANPAHDGIGLKLYANTQGTGKTGLFYVNTSNIRDEIISKNRSLLFSMIF